MTAAELHDLVDTSFLSGGRRTKASYARDVLHEIIDYVDGGASANPTSGYIPINDSGTLVDSWLRQDAMDSIFIADGKRLVSENGQSIIDLTNGTAVNILNSDLASYFSTLFADINGAYISYFSAAGTASVKANPAEVLMQFDATGDQDSYIRIEANQIWSRITDNTNYSGYCVLNDGYVEFGYDDLAGSSGNFEVAANQSRMAHTVKLFFDSPIYNFNQGTANYFHYLDASKNMVASVLKQTGTDIYIDNGSYIYSANDDSYLSLFNTQYELHYTDGTNISYVKGNASSSVLYFQSATDVGQVEISNAQVYVTHTADVTLSAGENVNIDAETIINIGVASADVINIGHAGATVNMLGTALYEYAANQYVLDKLITLNYGGAVASGIGVGFEIEENNVITGYFKTNATRNGFSVLTPAIAYVADISLASLNANRIYTLPDAAGTFALTNNKLSAFAATTSAELAGVISDETGSGLLVFNTAPTFVTSITSPLIIGGSGTTQTLTYKTTTGVGDTGADHIFQVGNNGATEAMRILNAGNVIVGGASLVATELVSVQKNQNASTHIVVQNTTAGTVSKAMLQVFSTGGGTAALAAHSSGFTTSGMRIANTTTLESSQSAGLNIGTTSNTQLSFWTNNTQKGVFLGTGEFIVGATSVVSGEFVSIQNSANSAVVTRIKNATSGTAASTGYIASNSSNASISMTAYSAGYTTSGINVASAGAIVNGSTLTGGLILGCVGAHTVKFYTNNTLRVTLDGSSGDIDFTGDAVTTLSKNSDLLIRAFNNNAGAAARSVLSVHNNVSSGNFIQYGNNYTTAGLLQADLTSVDSGSNVGILYASRDAGTKHWWSIGGTALANLYMTLETTALTLGEAVNLVVGTATGTKFGSATSQKIGFWNATPIVQPTTAVAAAVFVANTSGIADDTATFDGYTIGKVVKALRNIGLLA